MPRQDILGSIRSQAIEEIRKCRHQRPGFLRVTLLLSLPSPRRLLLHQVNKRPPFVFHRVRRRKHVLCSNARQRRGVRPRWQARPVRGPHRVRRRQPMLCCNARRRCGRQRLTRWCPVALLHRLPRHRIHSRRMRRRGRVLRPRSHRVRRRKHVLCSNARLRYGRLHSYRYCVCARLRWHHTRDQRDVADVRERILELRPRRPCLRLSEMHPAHRRDAGIGTLFCPTARAGLVDPSRSVLFSTTRTLPGAYDAVMCRISVLHVVVLLQEFQSVPHNNVPGLLLLRLIRKSEHGLRLREPFREFHQRGTRRV